MATSKAYVVGETAITFLASGGDVAFTNTSLGAGAGRQSAQHDFGASARALLYNWRAFIQFATAPVVGETLDIYIKTADAGNTHLDNDDGTGDAALSAEDKLRNLQYIGSITVDEASLTPEFSASGTVPIYSRFINIVFFNDTADALSSTAAEHGFILDPVVIQGQDT